MNVESDLDNKMFTVHLSGAPTRVTLSPSQATVTIIGKCIVVANISRSLLMLGIRLTSLVYILSVSCREQSIHSHSGVSSHWFDSDSFTGVSNSHKHLPCNIKAQVRW